MSNKDGRPALRGATKQRKREAPKGRAVDALALAEVEALLGAQPLRHDLLIEYLHLINDRYKQLGAPHLAALAKLLGLAQTQVYEVATFYHHFDVVKENRDGKTSAAPALTVRVCDGLSCEMAGAQGLLERHGVSCHAERRRSPFGRGGRRPGHARRRRSEGRDPLRPGGHQGYRFGQRQRDHESEVRRSLSICFRFFRAG